MNSNITDLMKPLYNTFVNFTNTVFDESKVPISSLSDITEDNKSFIKDLSHKYYDIRMDAAREALILDGFMNRYTYGSISETDLAKILKVLNDSINFANTLYEYLQYTDDETSYNRYKNHIRITKNIENISMVRSAIEVYNSKLIDFSEIDQMLSNYPYGAVIFDSTIDNESIKNDTDIIIAKLTALLVKLKDGGVKWADSVLHRVTSEPQPNNVATPNTEPTDNVNELGQQ